MAKLVPLKKHLPDLLALLLGAGLFLLVYGPSTLNPRYDSWIFNGYINVDVLQHYTGWVAFRAADWALPLTFTPYLSWPFGGAASLADCIPIMAIPLKLVEGLLPETFQYFGWFVLLCMALGGWAGSKLLGLFGLSPGARLLGSCFFAASPVLLERAFQHTALAAQFLVVLGLYLYFKARRNSYKKPMLAFVPLAMVATATHAYFVPMVLALAFATQVEQAVQRRRPRTLLWLLAPVAASLFTALLLGFFSATEYQPGGYGSFGLNLNAFWNPASYNWAPWAPTYQNLLWSRFLPQRPVVADSLEGFAYLGLAVLLALAAVGGMALLAALQSLRRQGIKPFIGQLAAFLKSHAGLLAACAALGAFAVSNIVTANSRTLLHLPLSGGIIRLCDMFRASGRLIWPVYYLLILVAIVGVSRLAGRKIKGLAPAAIGALLLLQLIDLSPVLLEKRAYFSAPVVPQGYHSPENWDRLASPGRVLYLLELREDRPTALRAALAGMPSNFFLLARGTPSRITEDMAQTREALLNGEAPNPALVYLTKDEGLIAQLTPLLAQSCDIFECDGYTVYLPRDRV